MQRALRFVPVVLAAGLLLVGVSSAVAQPRPLGNPSTVLTLVCAALVIAAASLSRWLRRGRLVGRSPAAAPPWRRREWLSIAAVAAVVVIACTIMTVQTSYRYGWDPITVQQVAEGTRQPSSARRYFSVYPNILPMLMIGKLAVWLERTTGLEYTSFFAVVAAVGLAVVLAAGLLWLSRRGARPGHAIAFIVLTALIVGISPWLGVPYTDLVTLPIPILVLALVSLLPAARGWRWWSLVAGLAVLIGLGWALKTTPVVLLAALVLGVLLAPDGASDGRLGRRPGWQRWGAAAAVVGLAWILSAGAVAAARPLSDLRLRDDIEVDTSLYVAAGMRTQVYADGQRCYGCFDRALTRPTYGKDRAAQRAVAIPAIRATLRERSVIDHCAFYALKVQHTWGDGMFFAWGEGLDLTEPLQHSLPHDSVLRAFGTSQGQLLGVRTAVVGGLWAGVLVLAALRLWQWRREWDIVAISSAVVGLFVFTTLFQGRGRYVLVMAPVLIVLACLPGHPPVRPARASARRGTDLTRG